MSKNKSTGPRSAAGKARSSMNALKTGIYSQSLIIPGEDPVGLATLIDEYFLRWCPSTPEQRDHVDILVRSTWTLRRLAVAEAQVWSYEMDRTLELNATAPVGHAFHECDRTLTRLQRMVTSTQLNHRDALRELERLQSLQPGVAPRHSASDTRPEPAPATENSVQPTDTKPVAEEEEFVPSTSEPLWVAPDGYHKPDSRCPYRPIDPLQFKRCPVCFRQPHHF